MESGQTNFELITSDILKSKLEIILEKIHILCEEIGPKITDIGLLREQAQIFYAILEKRGEAPEYKAPINEVPKTK